MASILFIPLNSNHVLIFDSVLKHLNADYDVLCHDYISDSEQYHTEKILRARNIDFLHFPATIKRTPSDAIFLKIKNFYRIKKAIDQLIDHVSPKLLVFAIDNDPIAQIFIHVAKKNNIKTLLIQEGLIRPYEYTMRKIYISSFLYQILRSFGVYLKYKKYGTAGCDKILASGRRSAEILRKRGVRKQQLEVVGQPKYDEYVKRLGDYPTSSGAKKTFLFAAGSNIVKDHANNEFLLRLIDAIKKCNAYLIVKMHPRTPETTADIHAIIKEKDSSFFEIIKQSDDTFDILKDIYALITVSSTMIIEALMMNKEGIVADYLAGEYRLDYSKYDAVHIINQPDQVYDVIKESLSRKKPDNNKKRLLENELFMLDGNSAERSANVIQSLIPSTKS